MAPHAIFVKPNRERSATQETSGNSPAARNRAPVYLGDRNDPGAGSGNKDLVCRAHVVGGKSSFMAGIFEIDASSNTVARCDAGERTLHRGCKQRPIPGQKNVIAGAFRNVPSRSSMLTSSAPEANASARARMFTKELQDFTRGSMHIDGTLRTLTTRAMKSRRIDPKHWRRRDAKKLTSEGTNG